MKEKEVERRKNYEELIQIVKEIFKKEGIDIDVKRDPEDIINASVGYHNGRYIIKIYSGLVNQVFERIKRHFERYDANDLIWFDELKGFTLLEVFDYDEPETPKEKIVHQLKHRFATLIFLTIIFHEYGHIAAGHIDTDILYYEFDSDLKSNKDNLISQEKEMVADWKSTLKLFDLVYYQVSEKYLSDKKLTCKECFEEDVRILRKVAVISWLSLYFQFSIFMLQKETEIDFERDKVRKHPPTIVRFLYCSYAIIEAIVNILNYKYELNDVCSEPIAVAIVEEVKVYVMSFLQLSNCDLNELLDNKEVFTYYRILRELPYRNRQYLDSYSHLEDLGEDYWVSTEEIFD